MLALDVLLRWFDVVAQLTALSVLLGPMKKIVTSRSLTRVVLGGACGGFSSLEMLQPLVAAPGIILDLRTLPVAIAAGFLGRSGAVAALAVALVTRESIGGAGATAGMLGLIVVSVAGLAWARRFGVENKHSLPQLMLLGLVPSLSLPFFLIVPGGVGWGLLQSTLPIYVPLNVAAVLLVGWVIDRERILLTQQKKLEVESRTDHLTGLLNRRGLEGELSRLIKTGGLAELLLVDFDRFKAINDQYGHAAGDEVLVSVARIIASEVGSEAFIARLGGDEFAIVKLTSSDGCDDDLAGRLIAKVRSTPITLTHGVTISASVSIGTAKWVVGDTLNSLFLRADQSLYGVKSTGQTRRRGRKPIGKIA